MGRFEGRVFTNQSSNTFSLTNSNGTIEIPRNFQVRHLPSSEISTAINQDPSLLYFRALNASGDPINQEIYYISKDSFDNLVSTQTFGSWVQSNYTPQASQNFRVSSLEYNQEYQLQPNAQSLAIELHGQNFGNLALHPGDKFYFEHGRDQDFLVIVPGNGRFTINNPSELHHLVQNNFIVPSGAQNSAPQYSTPIPPPQASASRVQDDFQENFRTRPTLAGSFETAVDTMLEINNRELLNLNEGCEELDDLNQNLNSCTSFNNYAQDTLNSPEIGLLQEEIRENAPEKFCILAGLQFTPRSLKFANCNANNEVVSSSHNVCQSKEYITFVYRELKKLSECFTNINMLELIPLMNAESNFNYNAYNTNNSGSLNASGLLQATQALIDSQGQSYIIDGPGGFDMQIDLSKPHCSEIMNSVRDNPLPSERNVCQRTSIPNGFRKNLYITMAQYSYSKVKAQDILDEIQTAYFGNVDLEIFEPEQKEQILVDLTRLMHNRGTGRITQRLETFFYDLFHGEFGQTQTRQGRTHGNASIHTLWGTPEFKAPLEHDQFINFFSSYLFYEGKSSQGSQGRKYEPNNESRDSEAGTYLHKMACEQQRLTLKAQEVSNSNQIHCGYPQINPDRLEHTQVEVGWYYNACMRNNRSEFSRRECSAKDPYKALDSEGNRRLTQESIDTYMSQPRFLSLCDSESLRGMASRPLLPFYSANPENYQ